MAFFSGINPSKERFFERGYDLLSLSKPNFQPVFGEADYYGASYTLHAQTSQSLNPFNPPISGVQWLHGADVAWIDVNPESYVYERSLLPRKLRPILVHRMDTKAHLIKLGYFFVEAVGSPILYSDGFARQRLKDSVLFIREHPYRRHDIPLNSNETNRWSLGISNLVRASKTDEYEIAIKGCLMGPEETNKSSLEVLDALRLLPIRSAEYNDINSLKRMVEVFSQFENVVTDAVGSHIAYAAYFGCDIALIGQDEIWSIKSDGQRCNGPTCVGVRSPKEIARLLNYSRARNSVQLPVVEKHFCGHPNAQAWASYMLGRDQKRNLEEMELLLGWKFRPSPRQIATRVRIGEKHVKKHWIKG